MRPLREVVAMTRLAAPQRALRIRKTLAALICLLLLGGIFTMILTGPSKIGNLAASGFSSTQPDTLTDASNQLSQFTTRTGIGQQHQTQPIATADCTGDSYISAYGDTVCTSETSPMTTVGATAPCPDGTSITQYGDTVCKPMPHARAAAL